MNKMITKSTAVFFIAVLPSSLLLLSLLSLSRLIQSGLFRKSHLDDCRLPARYILLPPLSHTTFFGDEQMQ